MAARQIVVPGAMPSRDRNGRALPGKLRFYTEGSAFSVPATIYTDDTLAVAHDFPILSDAAGRWPAMWADEDDAFDAAWTDIATDSPQGQWTGLSPADDAVLASADIAEGAADAAEDAQEAAEAAQAQCEAIAATLSGEPFTATSDSSNTITVATKTFVLNEAGTLFSDGQTVVAARDAPNAAYRMIALVNGTAEDVDGVQTLTLAVALASTPGSTGPFTDWNISLAADSGVLSLAGLTGIITAAQAKTALAIASTDITDFEAEVRRISLVSNIIYGN